MVSKTFPPKSITAFFLAAIIICSIVCFLFYCAQVIPFSELAESKTSSSGSNASQYSKPAMGLPDALENSASESSYFVMKIDRESTGRVYNMKNLLLILLVLFIGASVFSLTLGISYIAGDIMGCSSILALPIGGNSPPAANAWK